NHPGATLWMGAPPPPAGPAGGAPAAVSTEIGDRSTAGSALYNLLDALLKTQRFEEAVSAGLAAAAAFGAAGGDGAAEVHTLSRLGTGLLECGQKDLAVPVLRQYLTTCRRAGDRSREAQALLLLGATLVDVGPYEEAIGVTEQTADLYRALGDTSAVELTLSHRRIALQALGRGGGRSR
ncbi:hypothetical protein ACFWA0_19265, partial [Streptomyces xanthophaeus]